MERLVEESHAGNIDGLYAAIRENPNILVEIDNIQFVDTPLHIAASTGHIQYAMEIMRLMPTFSTKSNPDGFSPIHLAIQNEHTQLVIRLLEKKSDLVRLKGREDYTPLHYVVKQGNLQLLSNFLLVSLESIEDVTTQNETALHIALKNEKFEAFEFLVGKLNHAEARYFKKRILNWMDVDGNTVLHLAASEKQFQLVRLLISCNVDINAKNVNGWTALDYVQYENQTEIQDLLCNAGAVGASSIPIVDCSVHLLRIDQRLKMAAEVGDINGLYSIIEEDPYVLERIDQTPFVDTPLHIAASKGHTNFALEIKRLKPSFSRKLNQDGLSPLHLAFSNEKSDTAIRLLDVDGHLVRVKGKSGITPLHIAAEGGKLDLLVESLAACPKSIEDANDHKETALHIAAKNNRTEALDVIFGWLEYTGNRTVLNWTDNEGNTILHIASLKNQIKVVRILTSNFSHFPSILVNGFGFVIGIFNFFFPFINIDNAESSKDLLSLKNSKGLTAMDILEQQGQLHKREIAAMRSFAAKYEEHLEYGTANYLKRKMSTFDKWAIASFRNNLLISDQARTGAITVAILIATATYQAVLSPPRGLWEADPTSTFNTTNISSGTKISDVSNISSNTTYHSTTLEDLAGTSVMSLYQWSWFSIFNTAAFLASIMKINNLLSGGPINTVVLVFPLVSCYITIMSFISPPQHAGATIIYLLISAMVLLLYSKEVTKEHYITRCKKVVNKLQSKHRLAECHH